ncbi:hypothetical protein [Rhizosaccharibacter radicis]|uniref:WsaF C-terminal domain-containing protein n=1 Tax=Rhizosaccharibacter radicis TaxID=2782605 RepID=A0ABT1W1Y6_9PROT|nr:hypothetical protein [Acetobacteraceae bacterium KSS12]
MTATVSDRLAAALFITVSVPTTGGRLASALFDPALLLQRLLAQGLCPPGTTEAQAVECYLSDPSCRIVSPNALFDEGWYRASNPDVDATIRAGHMLCGLTHFVNYGYAEGRWPNAMLAMQAAAASERPLADALADETAFLARPETRIFLDCFPWIAPLQYYNLFARRLGVENRPPAAAALPAIDLVRAEFDAGFYRDRHMTTADGDADPFSHYLEQGSSRGASPNAWFDEQWYRAFYRDVDEAVARGRVSSGFHHFVLFGRAEGRLPAYDLKGALEWALPGVTEPTLLHRVRDLRRKYEFGRPSPRVDPAGGAPRVWFIFPVVNPDISFGGYQAAFALMVELQAAGYGLGLVCMEDAAPNRNYFLWRQRDPRVRAAFEECLWAGKEDYDRLPLRDGDLFVAYSVWGLKLARRLCHLTGSPKPFLLAQEHEPIFYANDALKVLCEEYYRVEHFPIINSHFLLDYLRAHRVGAFARDDVRPDEYAVFEHALQRLPRQTAVQMAARRRRSVLIYARPEAHAGRNLFDVIVLALEDLCAEGAFGPEWCFDGVGALSDLKDVPLGGGHHVRLHKKMDAPDYARMIGEVDIAISLMSAPHPSLVPFELATTGALVVTNVYENRSAGQLSAISGNIVPCLLGLEGLKDGIRTALRRVDGFVSREKNRRPAEQRDWCDVFNPDFLRAVFGTPPLRLRPAADAPRGAMPPPRPSPVFLPREAVETVSALASAPS